MFEPVVWPDDADAAASFLAAHEWPFHGAPQLTTDEAAKIQVAGDDTVSFWVRDDGETIGLVRVFDLDDLADGSPLFDLRIAPGWRGRGVGTATVTWLTDHLFTTYPELHRIEATTRHDNVAMQTVFGRRGYRLEGRLVETWGSPDGTRYDTLLYAILRREWAAQRASAGE
jgi:RimJ/RimL family protein N-acetyltransferase